MEAGYRGLVTVVSFSNPSVSIFLWSNHHAYRKLCVVAHTTLEESPCWSWTAMLASLVVCTGCRTALRNAFDGVDLFCDDCLERSRGSTGDELGGEA
jgi:hypothetical protein